jgi:hypothetical protein
LLAQVARTEEDPQAFLLTPAYRDDPGFHPGKPPLPSSDSDQLRGIQKALFLWLDRAAPDPAALARFVQGYDLPPLSDALPPYQWVFQAIREWDLKGGARNKLFSGIVGCLEHLGALFRREDETGWESWAEPLFLLCSLLEDAPQLGRPLFHLFELFERAVKRGERRLTLEVRSAFTSALLENGPAEKLLPVVNKIKDDPQSDPFLFASAEELKGAFTRMGRYLMQNPGKSAEQGALRIWGLQFDTQRPEEFKRKALVILNETLPEGWRRSELLFHAGCVIVYGAYLESRWNDLKFTRWIFQALAAELNPQPEDVDGRPEAKLVAKIVSFLPSASTPAIDLEAHFLSSVQSV